MTSETLSCEACSVPSHHSLVFKKWNYDILKCQTCGLGRAQIPSDFDPGALYTSDYFNGTQADGYPDYLASQKLLRREFRGTLRALQKFPVPGASLLEIGCAYGFFLKEAEKFYQCYGVEVSAAAAAHCQKEGLDVHSGPLTAAALGDRRFDLAVMLDCIEHLESPEEALATIRSHLNPEGLLMITTGDWGSLISRITGKQWRLMTPPQHLYYFTRSSLQRFLKRMGFEVLALEKPWKFVPLHLILFQLTKRFGISPPNLPLFNSIGLYVNLFDAMRVVAKKEK